MLAGSTQQRKKWGQVLLEGTHLASAWVAAHGMPDWCVTTEAGLVHPEVADLLLQWQAQLPADRLLILSDSLYAQLSDLGQSLPLLLVVSTPPADLPEQLWQDCVVLDGIQNAGNVGSILRSAAAAGVPYVLTTPGTAAAWSPKVLRAGMGAHFLLQILENQSAEQILQRLKVPLLATSSHTAQSLYQTELRCPVAWVFGNEGAGVRPTLMAAAAGVGIPQPGGMESLNVAAAAAICLFESVRQRGCALR